MTGTLDVAVIGLRDAGIAAARALACLAHVRVRLFDTGCVDASDVGPLFEVGDVGKRRSDVVAARQPLSVASPPPSVFAGGSSATAIEAAVRACLAGVDIALLCADPVSPLRDLALACCRSSGTPVIAVDVHERGGVVGPFDPGEDADVALGCPGCAQAHREDRGPVLERPHDADASAMEVLGDVAMLAMCEALETARGERPATARALTLDFERYDATLEPVSKHHRCALCYPSSGVAGTRTVLQDAAAWLRDLDAHRGQPPVELPALHSRLGVVTGERYGLFRSRARRMQGARGAVWNFFRDRGVNPRGNPLANAHAAAVSRTSTYAGRTVEATSVGFDFASPEVAESLALIEGLERLFAMSYCEPGRVVHAPRAQLGDDAFDPRDLPLYADWQYAQPAFPVRRFDPGEAIRWVGAVDLSGQRPLLVPFDLVYDDGSPDVIYRANSNGAACHTSLRQAIVNAIYEYVERDAFLVAWLRRLSRPRVSFASADADPWAIRATLERLDLQLEHVDISTDSGIPVLMGVLRDRRNPDMYLVDMVASLDSGSRIGKLYRELAQFLHPYLVSQTHYVTERTHSVDADGVRTFADHAAFYQTASRHALASFLTASPDLAPFSDDPPNAGPRAEGDELDALLHRLSSAGLRVLAVDCTAPLLRQLGLHAVKVLIPGLLPLNADHRLRVVTAKRLPADLNPWPHPFW